MDLLRISDITHTHGAMNNVELIIGRAGTGKTSRCLEQFNAAFTSPQHALRQRSFFIVPTIEHGMRVRDMLAEMNRGCGSFNVNVRTLDAFMQEMMEAVVPHSSLTPLRKRTMLETVVYAVPFAYYHHDLYARELAACMGSLISDLKMRGVRPQALEDIADALQASDPFFTQKIRDIAAVFISYEAARTHEALFDEEDVVQAFLSVQRLPKQLACDLVYIDGFFDFTESQYAFLRKIAPSVKKMAITLTTDHSAGNASLFAFSGQTLARLRECFPMHVLIPFPETKRSYSASIAFLEKSLFDDKQEQQHPPRQDRTVTVIMAKNRQDELRAIAGTVKQLVANNECRFCDIAVLFRTVDLYLLDIEKIFGELAIPCDIHERRVLKQGHLVKKMMVFLRLFMADLSLPDVADYCSIHEDNALQESLARLLQQGSDITAVTGADRIQKILEQETSGSPVSHILTKLFGYYRAFTEPMSALFFAERCISFFFEEGILTPDVSSYTTEELEVVKRVEELFEEIAATYQRTMSGIELVREFYAMLEVSLYSFSARTSNAVQLYNVANAKQKEYKVVFIAGLVDGEFPRSAREDNVLKDDERQLLAEYGIVLPLLSERIHYEKYLFYLAVTRATDRLFLTAPHYDEQGAYRMPSPYLHEVRKIFDDNLRIVERKKEEVIPAWDDSYSFRDVLLRYAYDHSHGVRPALCALMPGLFPELEQRLAAVPPVRGLAVITDERIRGYFKQKREPFSATALGTYQQCPFRYFIERVLGIQVPLEPFDMRLRGQIIHKTLELFYEKTLAGVVRKNDWILFSDMPRACRTAEALYASIVKEAGCDTVTPYGRTIIDRMKRDIIHLLESERTVESHRYTIPRYFEYTFGRTAERQPYRLEYPDGTSDELCGVIDRIDVCEKNRTGIIIDYKGKKGIDIKKFRAGEELQLILYMLYAQKHCGVTIAGAEYCSYRTGVRDGIYAEDAATVLGMDKKPRKRYTEAEWNDITERFTAVVRLLIEGIREARIAARPQSCDFCTVSGVCRHDKWAALKADEGDV